MKILKYILLIIALTVCTAASADSYYKVNTDRLNVRSGPNSAYSVLGVIQNGTTVISYGQAQTGWHRISFQGRTGYVSPDFLTYVGPVETAGKSKKAKPESSFDRFVDGVKDFGKSLPTINYWLVILLISIFLVIALVLIISDWDNLNTSLILLSIGTVFELYLYLTIGNVGELTTMVPYIFIIGFGIVKIIYTYFALDGETDLMIPAGIVWAIPIILVLIAQNTSMNSDYAWIGVGIVGIATIALLIYCLSNNLKLWPVLLFLLVGFSIAMSMLLVISFIIAAIVYILSAVLGIGLIIAILAAMSK